MQTLWHSVNWGANDLSYLVFTLWEHLRSENEWYISSRISTGRTSDISHLIFTLWEWVVEDVAVEVDALGGKLEDEVGRVAEKEVLDIRRVQLQHAGQPRKRAVIWHHASTRPKVLYEQPVGEIKINAITWTLIIHYNK